MDKEYVTIGEVFNVSLSNVPENANITWTLGDGKNYYGYSLTHSYEESDFYTIFADAKWDNGKGHGQTHMNVYNNNLYGERIENRITNRPLGAGRGYPISCDLYRSITQPNISVSYDISNAIGQFTLEILYEDYEEGIQKIILSEDLNPRYEDISRDYTITGDDIPLLNKTYGFEISIIIWGGYCNNWKESFFVQYY